MNQFVMTMVVLAARLRGHLTKYDDDSWADVPFYVLFVDTQTVVLFVRQFMEDASFVVRAALPNSLRGQMPAGFTDLAERIRLSSQSKDAELAVAIPATDPFRVFLNAEAAWFRELKDLRDDICHRSAYGRVRTARFPDLVDLMRAGGGKAPFASAVDLRTYLRGLFRRWLSLANVVSDFVSRSIASQHKNAARAFPGGFIIEEGAIDLSQNTKEPLYPVGTTFMTLSSESLGALAYFLEDDA
ncbi:MAG: hypothetical protein AMXMBFR57_38730 [Acidimicrobiia bacterium]